MNLADLEPSSDQLLSWRRRLNLTQDQAALVLGLSSRAYRYYETGGRYIPFRVALACIAYDGCPELRALIPAILARAA